MARATDDTGKTDFNDLYDRPAPIDYYLKLSPFSYVLADGAADLCQAVYGVLTAHRGLADASVLDLGCSYGVNAAIQKFGVSSSLLQSRYASLRAQGLRDEEVAVADRLFFAGRPQDDRLTFRGFDLAGAAVDYSVRAGLQAYGSSTNLQETPPSPEDAQAIAASDVVICTGTIGYIGRPTFEHVLAHAVKRPWFVLFVVSLFAGDDVEATLGAHGYVSERLDGLLIPQRMFASDAEAANVRETVTARGAPLGALERLGWYEARALVARPAEEAVEPLGETIDLQTLACARLA
jgi:hypothetical protein